MPVNKLLRIFGGLFCGSVILSGCTRPEIAEVLDDYCEFNKDCQYETVTQYEHSKSACEKFHKDLLNQSSEGNGSGCKSDVEQFFIDFMHAKMEMGCSASLMESLNHSQETQLQLSDMLACAKDKNENSSDSVADMGLHIIKQLDLDVNHMEPEVCKIIVGAVIPNQEDKVELICGFDLSSMDVEGCNQIFQGLEDAGVFSFSSAEFRQELCSLFTHAD